MAGDAAMRALEPEIAVGRDADRPLFDRRRWQLERPIVVPPAKAQDVIIDRPASPLVVGGPARDLMRHGPRISQPSAARSWQLVPRFLIQEA